MHHTTVDSSVGANSTKYYAVILITISANDQQRGSTQDQNRVTAESAQDQGITFGDLLESVAIKKRPNIL